MKDSTELLEPEKVAIRARYAKVCLIHTRDDACEIVAKEFGVYLSRAYLLTTANIPKALR